MVDDRRNVSLQPRPIGPRTVDGSVVADCCAEIRIIRGPLGRGWNTDLRRTTGIDNPRPAGPRLVGTRLVRDDHPNPRIPMTFPNNEAFVRRLATALLLLLTACNSKSGGAPATTTDSAGIAIVTSEPPGNVDTLATPSWSVSSDAGPLNDVADLTVTASGSVVIANANHTVVAFNNRGEEQWRFGRQGEGPGEFTSFLSLAALGDTVYAFDFVNRRLTAINPDGTLKGVTQIAPTERNLELVGGFNDGTLLFTSRNLLGPNPGINRDSVNYLRIGTDATPRGTVGWGRHRNVDFSMGEFGPNIHNEALGAIGSVAAHEAGVAHADGNNAQVTIRNADGSIARMVRWNSAPVPVSDADRDAFIAAERESTSDEFQQRQLEAWLPEIVWPAHLPTTGLVVSRQGDGLLVAEYCRAAATHCAWRDIDGSGRWRRTLWLPVRATEAVVVGDRLVTLSTDDTGFEVISAWPL
jgi:hypothetical protein